MATPDEIIDIYRVARGTAWRYQLEQFETSILQNMQRTVDAAKKQILADMETRIKPTSEWTLARQKVMLRELDELSLGLKSVLKEDLTNATASVGSAALKEAYETLSLNGLSPIINNVSLSPEQYKKFMTETPIPAWVEAAYSHSVVEPIQTALQIGALRGESYQKIVRKLEDGFDQFSKRELTTLARTFFQEANVSSHMAVMEANRDVVSGWIWTVAADDRVCPLCLPLSENFYELDEEHPVIPRHPRCRCMPRAKTKTWKELGIDLPELAPIEQAVVTRGYEKNGKWVIPPINTGTRLPFQKVELWKGGIKEAFPNMPDKQQIAMIGRKRFELLKEGKITLDDLVDRKTGRLFTIDELTGGKKGGGRG